MSQTYTKNSSDSTRQNPSGSIGFYPPETVSYKYDKGPLPALDVFTLGITAWCFIMPAQLGYSPQTPSVPGGCPPELARVIEGCTKQMPSARLSTEELQSRLKEMLARLDQAEAPTFTGT